MNSHLSPEGHFTSSERRPDETLYDYLVRCRVELTGRIRLLETVRDGQEMIYFDERARRRRHMLVLAIGEASFAVAGTILLDRCGISANLSTPALAVMIGLCAVLGAIASIAVLSMRDRLASWMRAARRGFWRLLDRIMPVDDASMFRPLPAWVDPNRPETIDAFVEARAASCLAFDTFFWRARWLIVQVVVIAGFFAFVQILRGASLLSVIEDTALVALVCLLAGNLFVVAADLISTNLARLGRWWRRR